MRAEYLVGRDGELGLALDILRQDGVTAVLLLGESGVGKSAMAAEIAARLEPDMVVMQIHGSPALSGVPYGVLAPYLEDLPVGQATSPVSILREFWSQFEKRRGEAGSRLVLVIDDAHELDDHSTQIVAELVTAGWARLVATSRPRPGLPAALVQLWYDGLAERLELRPLDKDGVAELAAKKLGGTVMASVVDVLHAVSEGNPLLLQCLLADSRAEGQLVRRNGVWLLARPLTGGGELLAEAARNLVLRASQSERDAMFAIALAEPVPAGMLEPYVGKDTIRSLTENRLVLATDGAGGPLRIWHPLYGEALRHFISPPRSLHIRERLAPDLAGELPMEGLLRRVSWALDCGADVDDDTLLQAAFHAAKRLENPLALAAARQVRSEALQPRARAVMAMVHYNDGDYRSAVDVLGADCGFLQGGAADDVDGAAAVGVGLHAGLLDVCLLWAASRAALGHASKDILADARATVGNLVAGRAESGPVVRRLRKCIEALELAELAREGRFEDLAASLETFQGNAETESTDRGAEGLFLLAMRCEALIAQGRPVAAQEAGREALSMVEERQDDVLFLGDFVLIRYALAALESGDWDSAEAAMADFAPGSVAGPVVFGGGTHALTGLSLLRQGRVEQASKVLTPAVEALRVADPLRLGGFGDALAFYAAAASGDTAVAERLAGEGPTREFTSGGSAYVEALAGLFRIAGQAHLEHRAKSASSMYSDDRAPSQSGVSSRRGAEGTSGLRQLQELESSGRLDRLPGVKFQNVVLRVELGDQAAMESVRETARTVEGAWVAGWRSLADAHLSGAGQGFVSAGNELAAAGMPGPAALAFEKAAVTFDAEGKRPEARQAAVLRDVSEANLGTAPLPNAHSDVDRTVPLTRRERDIIALAVAGLTDRQIAQKLMVSVRTVEGHLYRSYAKLGIRRREDLGAAVHE
ncbi:AAA family ATPase [Arthrobacter sp. fls2-241-R2A-200]|uniref:AAA family ATPase n=1 Tax=Arthrobacter sp. fls2-241-R2A-200 TaxID=3040281 RepID=UPI002550F3B1|nr:AAA family ATPase [Arthrobacter sp. fls2-241-R2A-200]